MTAHYSESWRDALRAIGRSPGSGWRSNLAHHGSRGLLLLALTLTVPMLFPGAPLPDFARLEQGQVATEDVIAEISFDVPKSPERLQLERAEAERGVAPIFTFDREAAGRATERVNAMFARLDSALAVADDDTVAIRQVLSDMENATVPTLAQGTYLQVGARRRALRDALVRVYDRLLPIGVVSSRDLSDVLSAQVIVREEGGDRLVRRDSLLDVGRFYARASELAPSSLRLWPAPGRRASDHSSGPWVASYTPSSSSESCGASSITIVGKRCTRTPGTSPSSWSWSSSCSCSPAWWPARTPLQPSYRWRWRRFCSLPSTTACWQSSR
jgi:hypothetical protein